jgi:hypothetical protein
MAYEDPRERYIASSYSIPNRKERYLADTQGGYRKSGYGGGRDRYLARTRGGYPKFRSFAKGTGGRPGVRQGLGSFEQQRLRDFEDKQHGMGGKWLEMMENLNPTPSGSVLDQLKRFKNLERYKDFFNPGFSIPDQDKAPGDEGIWTKLGGALMDEFGGSAMAGELDATTGYGTGAGSSLDLLSEDDQASLLSDLGMQQELPAGPLQPTPPPQHEKDYWFFDPRGWFNRGGIMSLKR